MCFFCILNQVTLKRMTPGHYRNHHVDNVMMVCMETTMAAERNHLLNCSHGAAHYGAGARRFCGEKISAVYLYVMLDART